MHALSAEGHLRNIDETLPQIMTIRAKVPALRVSGTAPGIRSRRLTRQLVSKHTWPSVVTLQSRVSEGVSPQDSHPNAAQAFASIALRCDTCGYTTITRQKFRCQLAASHQVGLELWVVTLTISEPVP